MSTEAYAYKSDFNSARDFRYRVRFTNLQPAGNSAQQGNYVPSSVESLVAAGTLTAGNVTKNIALAVERGNMRFAQMVAMLSEGENPVAVEPFNQTVDANGKVSNFTQIKNYPVQGFATGDVVPVVLIELDRLLEPLQSCLVNSVHDSMVIDTHPDEIDDVLGIIDLLNTNLNDMIKKEYEIEMNVPLLLESKIGNNWLDTKDVI